jgi:beta-ureidopropionase
MAPKVAEVDGNIARIKAILKEADEKEIDVLVLPELINSGYVFENMEEVRGTAEVIPDGRASKILQKWSEKDRLVAAGLCESAEEAFFNSAAIFAKGEHITTYRKIHLFRDEKEWFKPGNDEPPVVIFKGHRYGVMICFDWIFPEVARVLSLKGAEVILHPANLVLPYCQKAMMTRSIENGVFTATANRIGTERGVTFTGNSQITNPKGELLKQMSEEKAGVVWEDIKPEEALNKMMTERNHLFKDRRPELYSRLTQSSDD